jgi:hypothetical protein
MRLITDAEVRTVANLYDIPPVVAYGLAADVALEGALRADRHQRRRQQLAEMAARLEQEENEQ